MLLWLVELTLLLSLLWLLWVLVDELLGVWLELLRWLLLLSSTGTAIAKTMLGVTSGAFCSVAGAPGLGRLVLNRMMPGSLRKPL